MNTRKRALKRMARLYKDMLINPPFPYSRHIIKQPKFFICNAWSYKGKVQLGCKFCGGSGEYNYGDSNDENYDECVCARTGKGTGYTIKSYKNIKSLKRRFYFKNACDLPDFITTDESVHGAPDVVGVRYFNNNKDLCQTRLMRVKQHKNKKTLLIYSR